MAQRVFTNPEGPKVTPCSRALGPGWLDSFHCEVPQSLVNTLIWSPDKRMTAGTELPCPVAVAEVSAGATWRAGTDTQDFQRKICHEQIRGQDGGHEWTRHGEFHL